MYNCLCDCGNTTTVVSYSLKRGVTKSCGCLRVDVGKQLGLNSKKHGLEKSIEYKTFISIKSRCNNIKDSNYKNYGGRGIKCMYKSFTDFLNDVGLRPDSPPNSKRSTYQINRINNNGNYEFGNVNWVTCKENCNNRRPPKRKGAKNGQVL